MAQTKKEKNSYRLNVIFDKNQNDFIEQLADKRSQTKPAVVRTLVSAFKYMLEGEFQKTESRKGLQELRKDNLVVRYELDRETKISFLKAQGEVQTEISSLKFEHLKQGVNLNQLVKKINSEGLSEKSYSELMLKFKEMAVHYEQVEKELEKLAEEVSSHGYDQRKLHH